VEFLFCNAATGVERMDRLTYPLVIVHVLSFFAAIFATVWAVELYRLLKTGEVGKTWRILIAATIVFALSEVLKFGELLDFLPPVGAYSYLQLPFIVLLACACYLQRKAFFMPQHFRRLFLPHRNAGDNGGPYRHEENHFSREDFDLDDLELLEPIDDRE